MGAVFSRLSPCGCPLSTRRQYSPMPEQGNVSDMTIEQRLDALTGQLHSLEQRMKENATEQTHSLEQRMIENLTEQTHSLEQRMIENLTEQTHSLEQRMIENLTEQTHSLELRLKENETEQTHSLEQRMIENLTEQTHSLEQRMIENLTEQTHSLEQRLKENATEQTRSLQQRFDILEQLFQHPQPSEETHPKLTGTSASPSPPSSTSPSPAPSPTPAPENNNAGNPIFVYGTLQIATNITNTNDNTKLIAKLEWDASKDREMLNCLAQESQEQQRVLHQQQAQLADLRWFELALGDRMATNGLRLQLAEERVSDVATRLYDHFHIRLLGVETGLACILDTPEANWATVTEHLPKIEEMLTSLLPESSLRDDIQWNLTSSLPPDNVDLRLERQVHISTEERPQAEQGSVEHDLDQTQQKRPATAVTFDPVLSTLEPRSSMEPSVKDDRYRPWITAVLIINSLYVFMADNNNSKIKVFTLTAPHRPQHCVHLKQDPYGLAMVTGRQLVAVTSFTANVIVLVDVTTTPVVSKSISTGRRYLGVGSCDDGTLVVSCRKEGQLPASVDFITLEGVVVRTVTSSSLVRPDYLCVSGGTLYLSDNGSNCVHQVDPVTGQVTTQLRHQNLRRPRQVTVDLNGNLYVACWHSNCVLVRSAAGEWRTLLEGEQDGEGGLVRARCVCVTDTGLLLVGWGWDRGWFGYMTVVNVYQFT